MSRRYDSRTTTFSPEGRLYQVEYALEAISHAGTVIGILAKDGIVLVAEKQVVNRLLEQDTSAEKLYIIDDSMIAAVAGMTSDANVLIGFTRRAVQQYLKTYNSKINCEELVKRVCDLKQGYTQHGGLRPFGVSMIYAGWDKHHGFQLFQSDPSGNYGGWKATCMGANYVSAQSLLKQDYNPECTLKEAQEQALKILSKTMDSSNLTSEKVEIATVFMSKDIKPKPTYRLWQAEEIDQFIKDLGLGKSSTDENEESRES